MTWEEYQCTDAYRESHPDWNYKPTRREQEEELMRDYLYALDEYRNSLQDCDEDEEDSNEQDDAQPKMKTTFVVTKLWNCRVCGIIYQGDYESCLYNQYKHNLACIGSEWESAGIERVEYENEDELDEIINGYRECVYDDGDWYDEY